MPGALGLGLLCLSRVYATSTRPKGREGGLARLPSQGNPRGRVYGHSKREFNMGDDDADGGCCTLKRGSGIFILVLSIISLVGTVICAVIASATEMGLYAAFNWIHFVLLIYLISAASAYVCCRACGSKITGGLAVGYLSLIHI